LKKKILISGIVIIIILTAAACTMTGKTQETKESSIFEKGKVNFVRITASKTDVKSGLGDNFSTITSLNRDDKLDVLSDTGERFVVKLGDNRLGSIDRSEAKPIIKDDPSEEVIEEEKTSLSSLEREMLNLVNQERKKYEVNPLKPDSELNKVARIKAQDMVDNNYFSHYSPTYGSPFDMMKQFGIKFHHAGENLAANSSVNSAHKNLMQSSGHRKNILNPDFTHIGIGVKESEKYGYIFVQMFISKPS